MSRSPQCDHHWYYDFRVNRRRYRATTETANKQDAKKFEAKERSRILEGRQGIWQQPDITFRAFANTYLTDYAERELDTLRSIFSKAVEWEPGARASDAPSSG